MKTPREILLLRHRSVEPKLDHIRSKVLSEELGHEGRHEPNPLFAFVLKLWGEVICPCRLTWAGVACAWVLIVALHVASSEPASQVASQGGPVSNEEIRAYFEQQQMLAQLMGLPPEPVIARKPNSPGPRSDRPRTIAAA